jgi:PEGA domain
MRLALFLGPFRGILFAVLAGGLTFFPSAPASAKKPAAKTDSEAETPATNDQKVSSQANDVERPKTILDTNQEAPKTDSLGRVHFASPTGEGLGRVVVNAPAEAKVNVFLEGRFFGTAPVTIFSVPKGDYILEANYPSGKQVSKPVTVSENEETAVDLGGAQALRSGNSAGGGAEMTPNRTLWMRGFLIGSVAALAFGVTFGILEVKAQSNYENTPSTNQAQLDSLRTSGQRDATLADVGYIVAAAGAIGAAVCALPLIFGPSTTSEKLASPTAMVVTPILGGGTTGGALFLRF